jgi:hypothetical protein
MYHFCWDLTVIYSVSEIFRDDIVTKQEFDEVYFQAREVLYRRGTVVGRLQSAKMARGAVRLTVPR